MQLSQVKLPLKAFVETEIIYYTIMQENRLIANHDGTLILQLDLVV